MKQGDRVVVVETGKTGEIVETRKYVGCPYRVQLDEGGTYWCGPADLKREGVNA